MYRSIHKIHFVGIGGIGMSGIAEVLCNMGYKISGSDLRDTAVTKRLALMGCRIFTGHSPDNVEGCDVVVISSAIKGENPETDAAHRLMIPVIPRAEMLAELMRMKYGIAVAGAHGKTSTTSMIAQVLDHGGLDPTVVIGGRLARIDSNAKLGKGEFMVAEADESDGSFLKLSPTIAVLTNIDREHMDHYEDMDEVKSAFLSFINKVPFYGASVLCMDDPVIQDILPKAERRLITYGTGSQADYTASSISYSTFFSEFTVLYKGDELGKIKLNVPGRYNVRNCLASIAVAGDLGIPFCKTKEALEDFSGADRRFQLKGNVCGILVIDDYGHHPTEIMETLKAARGGWERNRIIAVFQPHRYTRVSDLFNEFCKTFYHADIVVVTDIYPAGEKPIEGLDGRSVYQGIKEHGHKNVQYINDFNDIPDILADDLKSGDIVITFGAGNIYLAGEELVRILKEKEK